MKSRRVMVAIASVLVTGASLAGCSGPSGGSDEPVGEPKSGGTLSWAVPGETQSMDPAICGSAAYTRCSPVFGTLLRYDTETEKFVPYLAESFESADGQNWTLKL
ncbi:MAG: ABC transporter substrate-binding protein, partial [Rhodococcus sp. (in: high G+C Gram-positive bacteria)]